MANNDINAEIVVDLDNSSVTAGARDITRTTTTMSQRLTRNIQRVNQQFRGMNQSIQSASNGLIGFGAKIAAVYGGSQAIKMVWEYNDGLKDSARRLDWNTQQLEAQKQAMFDVAMHYGVITSEMSQYVNEVMRGVQTTEEFEDKLKLGAIAMRGLALSGADAAKFVEALDGAGVSNPEFMMNRFANMGQAKNGRFKADEIAMATVDIMGNGSLANDQETMIQIGSMLQALSADGGSIADATNQLNSIINDMSSSAFREFAKERTGSDVFDVQDNKLVLKDLQTLIDLMAEDTKNGEVKNKLWYDQWRTLQGRLSADSASGIQSLAGKGDAINNIGKSQGISAEQTALDRARNFDASMSKLMTAMQRFADMNLADPIEKFALAMSQLDPSDIQNILNEAEKGAKALAAVLAIFAGTTALKNISLSSTGTVTMAVAAGVMVIEWLSKKANADLDKQTENITAISDSLANDVAIPFRKQTREDGLGQDGQGISINYENVNKAIKDAEYEMRRNPKLNRNDALKIAIDNLIRDDQLKIRNEVASASSWTGSWKVPLPKEQSQMADELAKGKDNAYGIPADKAQELYKALTESMYRTQKMNELKSQPQKLDVTTESVVKIENNTQFKATVIEKGSTVKEKLGYTGGGDY